MGLFTRREWQPDGTGVTPDSDDTSGGDVRRGDSYIVRYIRPDRPRSAITVTFCAVERQPGEFTVQRRVEWLVSETGGAVIWSDSDISDVPDSLTGSLDAADQDACELAFGALDEARMHGWDGMPERDDIPL